MRHPFLLVFLFLYSTSYSQNCSVQTPTNVVCIGNTLAFSVTFNAGLTPTSYAWSFGGASPGTSTQPAPIFQYPARGLYTPSVTINFSNATSCTVSGQPIKVVGKPVANFKITTPSPQCYRGNKTCILDLSTVGPDNAPLKLRYALFGDGGSNNTAPSGGTTICYDYSGANKVNPSYNDPLGGTYSLLLEITDTNNCTDQKLIKDSVTIWAKMQPITFKTNFTVQCNITPVTYINQSKLPLAQVKNYMWDFGDGSTATSPWSSVVHVYTKTGVFDGHLYVEDLKGCRDTAVLPAAGANAKIDSIIYLSKTTICASEKKIQIKSQNGAPAIVYWAFYRIGDPKRVDSLVNINLDTFAFPECGQYKIRMYVKLGNCFTHTDTLVNVLGPLARIETIDDAIWNDKQCEIHDTVYFRSPPKDHSCFYQNTGIKRLWDFGDEFALPCTTDTKNGINVNVNCRYSKDSINVKHLYQAGKEKCYFPLLILTDTIKGCTDTSTSSLKLTAPDAGWDSTITPVRRGLYYQGSPCLFSNIRFWLDETLPKCGRERAWILPDSMCPGASWTQVDTLNNYFDYTYNSTCDPFGNVTVGLVIKNGKDKNGAPCYDTAWYHWMFRLLPLDPTFNVYRTSTGCGPWTVKLIMNDSIQDSLTKTVVNFNNEKLYITLNGPTDTIISSETYTFKTPGIKSFFVTLTNTRGCVRFFQYSMSFGFANSFSPSKEVVCLHDTVTFTDDVFYYYVPTAFWRDSTRAMAGKEKLYWDVGDGSGFTKTGPLLLHKYSKAGNYRVKLLAIDSIGCRDTFTFPRPIKVTDVIAGITPMSPRYLCAPQILSFVDKSKYIDSSKLYNQQPYDSIVLWTWDFGDNKLPSYLTNPLHAYTSNGNFTVKLLVQTSLGCADSATIPILIDGPKPSFSILGDTVGCAPFKVNLKNTTGEQLISWVWYFRDQNNRTASTQADTNVTFTYTKGGIYKIYLVGEDTLFNPLTGQIKNCWAVFPDSDNVNAPRREVRVIDGEHSDIIGPDTICVHTEFVLTASSKNLVPGFGWIFDNFPTINKIWPDSTIKQKYDTSGTFRVRLFPQTPTAMCLDTSEKYITVTNVKADFSMDETASPLVKFTNLSKGAVRYEWNFGQPRYPSRNFSTLENPEHSYAGDTGTYLVCLRAYNAQDCYDSLCKRTLRSDMRLFIPNVFTPNGDETNDAFDIDIVGYNLYNLVIYNRWGNMVYRSDLDGIGNDGNNWNGRNFNVGSECPEGVYFFAFKYQMVNMNASKQVHGTVTLIRD